MVIIMSLIVRLLTCIIVLLKINAQSYIASHLETIKHAKRLPTNLPQDDQENINTLNEPTPSSTTNYDILYVSSKVVLRSETATCTTLLIQYF